MRVFRVESSRTRGGPYSLCRGSTLSDDGRQELVNRHDASDDHPMWWCDGGSDHLNSSVEGRYGFASMAQARLWFGADLDCLQSGDMVLAEYEVPPTGVATRTHQALFDLDRADHLVDHPISLLEV